MGFVLTAGLIFAAPLQAVETRSFHWMAGWSSGMGLTHGTLHVSDDEDARQLFRQFFPQFTVFELGPAQTMSESGVEHRLYPVLWEGIPLARAVFAVHSGSEGVMLLNGDVPAHLPKLPDEFPAAPAPHDLQDAERVWFMTADTLVAAWRGWRLNGQEQRRVVLAADSGTVLEEEATVFDAYAPVFEKSPLEADTVIQSLEALSDEGSLLDSAWLSVYGATTTSERAHMSNGVYTYDPDAEPALFDQVQSYFNIMRAKKWFEDMMGWEAGEDRLEVFTHATPVNNARYYPAVADAPASISLGAGDGKGFRYFSRDSDVVLHEFGHHIIYGTVKSARGESGVLHEGTADYFAYAINDDPNLAESVVIPQGPLRTALVPENQRYDDLNQPLDPHARGQYWAAFLWDLRKEWGEDADRLVFRSLAYLHDTSGLGDMLAALLAVDRELFGADNHGCFIMNRALIRGFSAQMAAFDGSGCGLDLARLAADRSAALEQEKPGKARWCGVIGAPRSTSALPWLTLPLIIVMTAPPRRWAKARRRRHES